MQDAAERERRRERESTLALEAASSRAEVALCQYYRGTLALTKMTPFRELVGSACAHTRFKMLTRCLESKRLALHSRMQGERKKSLLEFGKKDKIEGVRTK